MVGDGEADEVVVRDFASIRDFTGEFPDLNPNPTPTPIPDPDPNPNPNPRLVPERARARAADLGGVRAADSRVVAAG